MNWVRSPDYGNTLGAKRKRERDELRHELEGNMGGVVGGLDALAKAQKAAGLEVERKEDRSKKQTDDLEAKKLDAEKLARELEDRARKTRIDDEDRAIAGSDRQIKIDDLERKRREADEGSARARSDLDIKASRSVLERVVAAGIEAGKTPEEIANEARENPNLAAITGDEEVAAEYRKQRQPERDRIAKTQEQMAIDEARAKADMERDAARAALRPKGGGSRTKPPATGGGAKMPSDVRTRGKVRMIEMASGNIAATKQALKEFEDATRLPATGRYAGAVRGALTGWVPGLEEEARAKFNGAAESYNAMVFNILGREDAPAESENKRLSHLFIDENSTPAELRSKIAEAERQIAEQRRILGETTDVPSLAKGGETQAYSKADGPPEKRTADIDSEIDAILDEHPDWTEEQIEAELKRRQNGG